MASSRELLHHRYADALFETASEAGLLDKVMEELEIFSSEWLGDKKFHEFLMHPLVDREEKKTVLARLGRKKGLSAEILHFLNVLIDNKRENLIHAAFLAYRDSYENSKRVSRILVETARPVSKKEKTFLVRRLSEAFGRNIHVETEVSPGIIGGLKILYKDTLYDSSILAKLGMLEEALSA